MQEEEIGDGEWQVWKINWSRFGGPCSDGSPDSAEGRKISASS
jgi:hypothetical protein